MRYIVSLVSLICSLSILGQGGYTTNNNELEEFYDRIEIMNPYIDQFTDVKPIDRNQIARAHYDEMDTLHNRIESKYIQDELFDMPPYNKEMLIEKKLLKNLYRTNAGAFTFNRSQFSIRLNPILELKAGRETESNNLLTRIYRGIELQGHIEKKINYYLQITENQTTPNQYILDYASGFYGQNKYIFNPNYTYWKDINNNRGFDFSNTLGYIEYKPSSSFSIMMGHDRNHYGYGYRSLFLGDNGAPYFQLKMNAYIWKFHYQALFSEFTGQYIRGADRLLPKKYGAFHLLTFKPIKKLDIGLFEGVVFNRSNGFELNYLNPLIFYHSIEHTLGSSDNVLIGAQIKYNVNTHTQFYSQFLLDDIQIGEFINGSGWFGNKYGIQLGSKFINIANVNTLDAQIELNLVRPYTYSHYNNDGTDTIDNYSHYNQPLAHPFGANFFEFHGRISYKPIPKLKIEFLYNYSERGQDSAGFSMGNNIFANTTSPSIPRRYNNEFLQGNRTQVHFLCLKTQYMIYHNMFLDFDIICRSSHLQLPETTSNTIGVLAGIRINLRKRDLIF